MEAIEVVSQRQSEFEPFSNNDGLSTTRSGGDLTSFGLPDTGSGTSGSITDFIKNIDPEKAKELGAMALKAGMTLSQFIQKNPDKKMLKSLCGRKPVFKKNRGDYDACVKAQTELMMSARSSSTDSSSSDYNSNYTEKKGLSKGAKIGIGILITGVVIAGIYFGMKAVRNKGK